MVSTTPYSCRVTPPLGNTASGRTGTAYDGKYYKYYYTPTLRSAMWHACGHKGAQTSLCPSQSPSHSFKTAHLSINFSLSLSLSHKLLSLSLPPPHPPPGTCLRPWGEGFGIPNRSPDPLVRRAGRVERASDSERESERPRARKRVRARAPATERWRVTVVIES